MGPYTREKQIEFAPPRYDLVEKDDGQMIWRTTRDGKNIVIFNWEEIGSFDLTPTDVEIVDGKPLIILRKDPLKEIIVEGGKRSEHTEAVKERRRQEEEAAMAKFLAENPPYEGGPMIQKSDEFYYNHHEIKVGNETATPVEKDGRWYVEQGTQLMGPYDEAGFLQVLGSKLFFLAERDGKSYAIFDGAESEALTIFGHGLLPRPALSGSDIYYVGKIGDQSYIIKNGRRASEKQYLLWGPIVDGDDLYFISREYGTHERSVLLDKDGQALTAEYSNVSTLSTEYSATPEFTYVLTPYYDWWIKYGDSLSGPYSYDHIYIQRDSETRELKGIGTRRGNTLSELRLDELR
ncbi:hypothetical protein CO046_02480 [Candidatus Peregrinibacteria bacterium CG_4_9_14_0_2_um_filter_53_11]|nr:MAG: hypothetical protein CO046_02480 [Candidatus Peregrinibacteria bacterium CG_4_9_14_0_2_um_filter_53_11]